MKKNQHDRGVVGWTIRRARTLAAGAGLAVIAACGGDSGPSGPTTYKTPAGTYDVATINAKAPPVAIFSGDNYTYEVTAGTLVLTGDGKFSVKQTTRQTVAGKVDVFVDSTYGTWAQSGTTVNFTNSQDGSADRADWSNLGTLTFVETEGTATNTYVFRIR